jgi:hypothetical protein
MVSAVPSKDGVAGMKFDKAVPVKIVMLGAGGTGGHIAPHLYRLLYSLDRPVRFIIADGDLVEQKNLVRQNFIQADLGENKGRYWPSGIPPCSGWKQSISRNLWRTPTGFWNW